MYLRVLCAPSNKMPEESEVKVRLNLITGGLHTDIVRLCINSQLYKALIHF